MADDPEEVTNSEEVAVEDEASKNEEEASVHYDIASFGWDADVDGLVRRVNRGDIVVPPFQRSFVWSLRESSRFIESLLLGLPVPGIFLAEEHDSKKQLVLDGQQRLKSLQFFEAGVFNPKPEQTRQRVFRLERVQEQFEGKTYEDLDENDRRRLENAIIPATIVKQLSPNNDDTSIYHIFERLNSTGRKLTKQQIRAAIYHGPLATMLAEINENSEWREIYGPVSPTMKDQELVLRFLALFYSQDAYRRPMYEFLNTFSKEWSEGPAAGLRVMKEQFEQTISIAREALGSRPFRLGTAMNAAVFDSVMVGLAKRLERDKAASEAKIRHAYDNLLHDEDFVEWVSRSTADEDFLRKRIDAATKAFAEA